MIERQFISQNLKEKQIQEYLKSQLRKTGYSHAEIKRTPLGEKIIVYTTHPGIVVGRKGENIQRLTQTLKKRFKMENPQIEIGEIENQMLDVEYVCDRIVSILERLGSRRFKSVGYRILQEVMDSGAMGAEIMISGKVPSARARSWRFSAGYLKKSGDTSENYVQRSCGHAKLKSGIVGIRVSIMLPDTILGDSIKIIEEQPSEPAAKEVSKVDEPLKKAKDDKPKETKKIEPKEETKVETKKKEVTEKAQSKEIAPAKEAPKKEIKEDGNTKKN